MVQPSNARQEKIAVTGAGGFIGRALTLSLAERGYKVIALDNNFRGSLATVEMHPNISLKSCDILDRDSIDESIAGMDMVFHLAAINGTENFYSTPDKVMEVGVIGTHNVVQSAKMHNIRKVVFASSSEAYSTTSVIPTPETVDLRVPDVLNPRFSYGGGKLAGELIVINYLRGSGTEFTVFRPHNVIGPQMGFEHVIPQLVGKIFKQWRGLGGKKRNISIEIQGSGRETRSFIDISDAVRAIEICSLDYFGSGIFHIGTEKECSIYDLVREIGQVLGFELEIISTKVATGSPLRRCPDTSKLRSLGFAPRVEFSEAVKKTAQWYWQYFESNVK